DERSSLLVQASRRAHENAEPRLVGEIHPRDVQDDGAVQLRFEGVPEHLVSVDVELTAQPKPPFRLQRLDPPCDPLFSGSTCGPDPAQESSCRIYQRSTSTSAWTRPQAGDTKLGITFGIRQ